MGRGLERGKRGQQGLEAVGRSFCSFLRLWPMPEGLLRDWHALSFAVLPSGCWVGSDLMEAVLVVLSYPCGPPPKFLDSILVFFEVPCFSLLQWLSTLRMLSKAKSIPSPLKMHGSPSLKLLKSETRDKMKHMFNFSLRSSSVHSPCPLVISRFKKDMWQYCVCILWTCM